MLSIYVHLFCQRARLVLHVDVVTGGGNETIDRIMRTVRKEFDFGAWDVGNFRFKDREISQRPTQPSLIVS